MKNTTYFANYTIGKNAYDEIGEICGFFGKKIAVVSSSTAKEKTLHKIQEAIKNTNLEIIEIIDYGQECTKENMQKCSVQAENADMIFGIGGGKAIDTAKGVSDLLNKPIFTFPSIASTCASITALSVVYKEDGKFDEFTFYKRPPAHCFIDLQVIANAPKEYLRAGIGDTLGKHYECHFSSRNDELLHSSNLGRKISDLCMEPVVKYGVKAMKSVEKNEVSEALSEVVLANIVSTGMVSNLVLDQYNCALAHSVYYGLVLCENFEENNLHGDVVAYGVLVQLAVDEKNEEMLTLCKFLKEIGIKTKLSEMGAVVTDEILEEIVTGPDMEHIPYEITKEMVEKAMQIVEKV